MVIFFEARDENKAKVILDQKTSGSTMQSSSFLKRLVDRVQSKWDVAKNFFKYRVTTAVSEGINIVIRAIKR